MGFNGVQNIQAELQSAQKSTGKKPASVITSNNIEIFQGMTFKQVQDNDMLYEAFNEIDIDKDGEISEREINIENRSIKKANIEKKKREYAEIQDELNKKTDKKPFSFLKDVGKCASLGAVTTFLYGIFETLSFAGGDLSWKKAGIAAAVGIILGGVATCSEHKNEKKEISTMEKQLEDLNQEIARLEKELSELPID